MKRLVKTTVEYTLTPREVSMALARYVNQTQADCGHFGIVSSDTPAWRVNKDGSISVIGTSTEHEEPTKPKMAPTMTKPSPSSKAAA